MEGAILTLWSVGIIAFVTILVVLINPNRKKKITFKSE